MCQVLRGADLSNVLIDFSQSSRKLDQIIPGTEMFREAKTAANSCSKNVLRPGFKYRFGRSHHTSLLLCYPVALKARTPSCPLHQTACPETMPSPPAVVCYESSASQPLSWGPASLSAACSWPCGAVPLISLPANHTCPSLTIKLKTHHLRGSFSEFISINTPCILFHKEFDKAYEDKCNSKTIKYEYIWLLFLHNFTHPRLEHSFLRPWYLYVHVLQWKLK